MESDLLSESRKRTRMEKTPAFLHDKCGHENESFPEQNQDAEQYEGMRQNPERWKMKVQRPRNIA